MTLLFFCYIIGFDILEMENKHMISKHYHLWYWHTQYDCTPICHISIHDGLFCFSPYFLTGAIVRLDCPGASEGGEIKCKTCSYCLINALSSLTKLHHDDVIKWKHFPRYWPFVQGIDRSPVNSPHKGQWRGVLMFSVVCTRINGWVNNREAGDLKRHQAHYDVIVMTS